MKKSIFIAILVVIGISSLAVGHAKAVGGRALYHGYFTNAYINNYGPWLDVWQGGIQSLGTRPTKAAFENLVNSKLNDGNQRDMVGAAYIILTMLGRNGSDFNGSPGYGIQMARANFGDWKNRVDNTAVSLVYDPSYTYDINSTYLPSINDIGAYREHSTWAALKFVVSGQTKYVIKMVCANPLGDFPGLPSYNPNQPPTGSITVTCNLDGTAAVKFSFSDPDGPTNAFWMIYGSDDTTPSYPASAFHSPPWNFASNSPTNQTASAQDSINGWYARMYVKDSGPGGSGNYYHVNSVKLSCAQPGCGQVIDAQGGTTPEPGQPFQIKLSFSLRGVDVSSLPSSATVTVNNGARSTTGLTQSGGNLVGTATFPGGVSPAGNYTYTIQAGSVSVPASGLPACNLGVAAKPYISVVGGDVLVGVPVTQVSASGGNTVACGSSNSQAMIISWNKDDQPGYSGSGGRFGVMAMDVIAGFPSNQYVGSAGTELSFANTTHNDPPHDSFGGKFGSYDSACSIVGYNADINSSGATPSGVISGRKVLVFNGDVQITNNIKYDLSGGSGNLPALTIIARGGNIYIDSSVTQLDGAYVAQPKSDGSGGDIYTCATAGSPVSSPEKYDTCSSQLAVNGSLIANMIYFDRACGTLAQAGNADGVLSAGDGQCTGLNKAAEVFNYSAIDWLGQAQNGGTGTKAWDSVVSLPPVL